MLESKIIGQFQLQTSLKCHATCIGIRFPHFLVASNQVDPLIVTNGQAFKTKFTTKQVTENPTVDVTGDSFDLIERGHHCSWFCIADYMPKWNNFGVKQFPWSVHIRRAVSSPLRAGITCEVLKCRRDMVRGDGAVFRALQTPDHSGPQACNQIGVFPECLIDTSPSQITGDVQNG